MFKWSSTLLVFLLLLLLFQARNCGDDQCIRSPSSCGPIRRISYPFRLSTDPASCGNKLYEFRCECNVPVVFFGSHKYYVRSINYNNYTIRLSDASLVSLNNNNSSSGFLCNHSAATTFDFLDSGYAVHMESPQSGPNNTYYLFQTLAFISCPSPISSQNSSDYMFYEDGSVYSDGYGISASLPNDSPHQYWYARVSDYYLFNIGYVADSCRMELKLDTSMPLPVRSNDSVSYKDVNDYLNYGFELSWFYRGCIDNVNGSPKFHISD